MKRLYGIMILVLSAALLLFPPAAAAASSPGDQYVWDTAGIMSESEAAELERRAQEIAETYHCATYIVTLDDYRSYDSSSVFDAATSIYSTMGFGYGSGKDGEMLMLSMDDRDFALIAYGDFGNACFTDYGKEKLDEVYLDNFRNNDWYGGFSDYLTQSEKYLKMGSEGSFFDVDNDPDKQAEDRMFGMLISLAAAAVISLIVCGVLYRNMKTASEAGDADFYTVDGSFRLTGRNERFIRRTTARRKIEKNTRSGGGGGTSVNSGGFSGHSGKF